MQKRPLSLSIIGWLLVVTGLLGSIGVLTMSRNPTVQQIYQHSPLPMWAHVAFGTVGIVVTVAAGYGILKGVNWSRFLYVGWSLIGFVMSMITIPVTSFLILGLVFFVAIVFFLFRPEANAWFRGPAEPRG